MQRVVCILVLYVCKLNFLKKTLKCRSTQKFKASRISAHKTAQFRENFADGVTDIGGGPHTDVRCFHRTAQNRAACMPMNHESRTLSTWYLSTFEWMITWRPSQISHVTGQILIGGSDLYMVLYRFA